ncbi:MAG: hypothetical protein A4E23_01679 [Methanomethylovorans sp. PtaU1.Bin073]|nr:MAG: hypothetical protein A4E23_01679 [Methanomethylovorans sp. PtaU1.Bin073]
MPNPLIGKVDLELRKIRASKLKISEYNTAEVDANCTTLSDEDLVDVSIKLGLKSSKDKKVMPFFLVYNIPSFFDDVIEINAEFVGKIHFTNPFDIESQEKLDDGDRLDIPKMIMPIIAEKVEEILSPVFKAMNVEYRQVPLPAEDDDKNDNSED